MLVIAMATAGASLLRPQIEPDLLVDELQSVGLAIVDVALVTPTRTILSKKSFMRASVMAPTPSVKAIARIDDAEFLHLGDRIGDQVVGHLRIVLLDHRVGRLVVAVEVIVPADDRGIDEALHQVGLLLDESRRVSISVE